jgi:hypothetical protein
MAQSNRYIFFLVFSSLAAGVCGAIEVSPVSTDPPSVQPALENLHSGRHALAEQQAHALANRPTDPVPRAWMIVGAARQAQQQYPSADRAYRMFLATCTSPEMREYALRAIAACEEAGDPRSSRQEPPSRRLSEDDRQALAVVEEQTATESTSHFIVHARSARLAKLAAAEAEAALKRICRVILAGQEYPHGVDIYIWSDRKEYLAHAGDAPEWSGGSFSIRSRDGSVSRRIDLTQRDEKGDFAVVMLDRVLPHELCHLVLKEYFGDADCPLFLGEGLAALAESEMDNERILLAGAALASKAKIPMDDLVARGRQDMGNPSVYYAESFSFMEFLRNRLTERQFREFLLHVKAGCPVTDALQRALYVAPCDAFPVKLAIAWEEHAILQAQFIRTIRGMDLALTRQ